jgi:hypothetical protein
MNEEKLEFLIQNKYSEELMRHGIIHTKGFKDRVIYFNEKLTELAKKFGITPMQYLAVLDSDYRSLYEFQEKDFYCYIIKDMHKIFFTDYLKANSYFKDFILDFDEKRAKNFNWTKETSGYRIIMNGLKEPHLLKLGFDFWHRLAKNLLDNNITMINDFKKD